MKLSLGTVQFGIDYGISNTLGKINSNEAKKIIKFAFNSGIKSIDTAISYGDSEECLGDIGVSKFDIVTKLPPCCVEKNEIFNWVVEEVGNSLKRLKQDKIYGLLVHDSNDLILDSGKEVFEAMSYLKKEDKVSKIGLSAYSPDQIIQASEKYDIDIVQAPLNIIDRRLIDSGCLDYLKIKKIEVHTRSCFLQGLLLMDLNKIPRQFKKWNELFICWHNWLAINNKDALQTCLSYPLSFAGVDRVIIGIDSLKHLCEILSKKNITAMSIPNLQSNDENLINPMHWNKK